MINKNYFVINDTDKEDFDNHFSNYKKELMLILESKKAFDYEEFSKISDSLFEPVDLIMNKYGLLDNIKKSKHVTELSEYMMEQVQDFFSPLMQNKDYFGFIKTLKVNDFYDEVSKTKSIKSFEKNGLSLSESDQEKLNNNSKEAMKLSILYSDNIVNSKKEWLYHLTEELKNTLTEKELSYFEKSDEGFILKYKDNDFSKILQESSNRELKKIVYDAINYPASSKSSYDNTPLLSKILELRKQRSEILGKGFFTNLVLEDRMAKKPENVTEFLSKMHTVMYPLAVSENEQLLAYGKDVLGFDDIQPYDRSYISTKYKEEKFNYINDSERKYFKVDVAYKGCFELAEKLFGFTFIKRDDVFKLPYEDTDCYEVLDGGVSRGFMIVDLYERPDKIPGAWVSGIEAPTTSSLGIISLNCNFNKKDIGLNLGEINTLLHELGHALHLFSSIVKYSGQSGTNGIAWDAVEIPSQMLEQFSYDRDFVKSLSWNEEEQSQIPDSLLDSLIDMKNYMIGTHYVRQIGFGLFDINIHNGFDSSKDITEYYKELINSLSPVAVREDTSFPNTFSHIFAGGYASGYYGYMWADIYSIDAYLHIKDNIENALKFKNEFLRHGSSKEALDLYLNFRGQEVQTDKFLNYYNVR